MRRASSTGLAQLPLAPFFGSIGVAPPVLSGRLSSTPPGWHGGNLDNKDLIAGSVLYLPVHVLVDCCRSAMVAACRATAGVTGAALETSLTATIEVRASAKVSSSSGLEQRRRRTI